MREVLRRWLRHEWASSAHRFLSAEALQRLSQRVAQGERRHSGEIRICVESRLPRTYLLRRAPIKSIVRARAVAQFGKLRVWDTEHNNGVLVYLLTAERTIELVADRGACKVIAQDQWQAIVTKLGQSLRQGNFEAGLDLAVDELAALLQQHFPMSEKQDNPNELPDGVSVDGELN